MDKKICIIHFNTPALTHCLVRSINKYTPGATIYIFDNSDKKPFVNTFDNVIVFDNTKGELINFDEILKKFPLHTKSRGKTNNYGSAKHSMSIQKCVELIDDNFVLLDSDVLLKRDITPIFNTSYVWVAGVEEWTNKTLVGATKRKRVCPFLMFMNVVKMKELGIRFYDDEHMLGFNNGPKCEEYETGVWFYEATPKQYRRVINYNDYIRHFRAGSWLEDARTKHKYKQMDPKKWLIINKKYWASSDNDIKGNWYEKYNEMKIEKSAPAPMEKKELSSCGFDEKFDHIYCLHYLPDTDRVQKIKEELKRVGIDECADYFTWFYDYPSPLVDLIYKNPKMKLDTALVSTSRAYIKRISLKHYEIMRDALSRGYNRILVLGDDILFHKDTKYVKRVLEAMPDSDVVMLDKMTCSSFKETTKYRNYVKALPDDSLYGDMRELNSFLIFCSCYSVNRTAMEKIIALQEEKLLPPDTPLNDKELSGSFAVENIAIRNPEFYTRKDETYDRIGIDVKNYGPERQIQEKKKVDEKKAFKPLAKQVKKTMLERGPKTVSVPKKVNIKIPPKQKRVIRVKTDPGLEIPSKKKVINIQNTQLKRTRVIYANGKGHNKLYEL